MKPDYSGWHIDHLEKHRRLLHRMLKEGEKHGDVFEHLHAIDDELKQRVFALVLTVGGNLYWDYGMWRSEADCAQHAKQMGLEVGKSYQVGDAVLKLEIRKM